MIRVRRYNDTDEDKIRDLFKKCFGREMSYNEWVWKYKMSPWGSLAYVALDNKKLVSHFGAIRYSFYQKGDLLWAYQLCDIMTHPDYRGKIYGKNPPIVKVTKIFYKENIMDFAFGFPSERHARLQTSLLEGSQHKRIKLLKKCLVAKNKIEQKTYILKVGWENINKAVLDDLWKSCNETYNLSIFKDSNYIIWRYMKHPSQYYTLIGMKNIDQKKIIAIAVIKCSNYEMSILDFFVGGSHEIFSVFWDMLESYAIKMQVSIINVWANLEENISKYLLKLGYKIIEDVPFQIRVISKNKINHNEFYSNYNYRMGDLL